MNISKEQKIALVVDDDKLVCQALRRLLDSAFDQVITTSHPRDADQILSENRVTHLICDCNLGEGLPLGYTFIPNWKKICPSIERTVVFSGSDLSTKTMPDEVDVVLGKNIRPEELVRALTKEDKD